MDLIFTYSVRIFRSGYRAKKMLVQSFTDFNENFSLPSICTLLQTFNPSKSTCPDGLSARYLKRLFPLRYLGSYLEQRLLLNCHQEANRSGRSFEDTLLSAIVHSLKLATHCVLHYYISIGFWLIQLYFARKLYKSRMNANALL